MCKQMNDCRRAVARWSSVAVVVAIVFVLFASSTPATGQRAQSDAVDVLNPFTLNLMPGEKSNGRGASGQKTNNGVGTGEKPFPGVGPAWKSRMPREWIRIPSAPPFRSPFRPGPPR